MVRKLDLTNKRFGRLIALSPLDERNNGHVVWRCKCDCGNSIDVSGSYLVQGDVKSCGCLKVQTDKVNLGNSYNDKRIDGVVSSLFKNKEPRKDSKGKYRGVQAYRTRTTKSLRYRAWITVKGQRYYKSGFMTEKEAYYNGRLKLEKEYLPFQSEN